MDYNPTNYRYNLLINPSEMGLINQLNAFTKWGTTNCRVTDPPTWDLPLPPGDHHLRKFMATAYSPLTYPWPGDSLLDIASKIAKKMP